MIRILIPERSIEKVLRSHGEKSESFRPPVTDGRVDDPEPVLAGDEGSTEDVVRWLEQAFLIKTGGL